MRTPSVALLARPRDPWDQGRGVNSSGRPIHRETRQHSLVLGSSVTEGATANLPSSYLSLR